MRRGIVFVVTTGAIFTITAAPASGGTWAPPTKQANAGDSISQGFDAEGLPFDDVAESWVRGTDPAVASMYLRYAAESPGFVEEGESVTGAEMVGGEDDFPAQAARICAQSPLPNRVEVLLGSNDVCNRPRSWTSDAAANLYSVATFTAALRAGLDQLAACLPPRSVVEVLSMPRVDYLYEAGRSKSLWCVWGIWPLASICRVVTGESSATRRAQIGARIDAYNGAIGAEIAVYGANANGRNPRGIGFVTDWSGSSATGHANTSVGTFVFSKDDINGTDCFHPNVVGQSRIACVAWGKSTEGAGVSSACFAR